MRLLSAVALLGAILCECAAAQAPHRELGAHEHGRGMLNIAMDRNKVTMELETPGADIVGFEHAASTRRDNAAIDKAKGLLAAPLTLFKLPAAANCRVTEANVEVEIGDRDHDGKKGRCEWRAVL